MKLLPSGPGSWPLWRTSSSAILFHVKIWIMRLQRPTTRMSQEKSSLRWN